MAFGYREHSQRAPSGESFRSLYQPQPGSPVRSGLRVQPSPASPAAPVFLKQPNSRSATHENKWHVSHRQEAQEMLLVTDPTATGGEFHVRVVLQLDFV